MTDNVHGLTLAAEMMKIYYLPGLREQINTQGSPLMAQIERNKDKVYGNNVRFNARYGRVGGIGRRADTGLLPTPSQRKSHQVEFGLNGSYVRFQLTDQAIEASKSDVGAFTDLLEQSIMDCESAGKYDQARQAQGDGTGVLSTFSAAKAGDVGTVRNHIPFAEGMRVDILDATDGATWLNQDAVITAVTRDAAGTGTITIASLGVIADTDTIYVAGNKDLELTGVKKILANSNTVYGINRSLAEHAFFNAQRLAVNGEISEILIQQGMDLARTIGGGKTGYIQCSLDVYRAYLNLMLAQKSTVNSMDLKGGHKALSFNGTPIVGDEFVSAGFMQLLDLEDWSVAELAPWDWMDMTGSMFRPVSGYPAVEATLRCYQEVLCTKPAGQVDLYGITGH